MHSKTQRCKNNTSFMTHHRPHLLEGIWLKWKYLNVLLNVLWSLSVSSSFLDITKSIQNTNIFWALVPIQEGSLGNREELVAAGHSHPPAAQGPLLRSRWGQVGALPDLGGV